MQPVICEFDIAIAGGGPTGAALALALKDSGLAIVVLEARSEAGASDDARTLAMSHGSRLILERLDVWDGLRSATPIESIHVSQRGGFGRTMLSAREAGLPALGYVVRYSSLQRMLGSKLGETSLRLMTGTGIGAMQSSGDHVAIELRGQGANAAIRARLVVVADGGGGTGSLAGAEVKVKEYGQHAVVGLVGVSRTHAHRAYERFTPEGPIALLPFEDRYALVWTAAPADAERLMSLAPGDFLRELQRRFGDRAGRFQSIVARARFPLALRYATDPSMARVVMLGNAAQALHPIAGQGFNLGLRDAWELADALLSRDTPDPGSDSLLSRYRGLRRPDRRRGIALTHSLVKIFSNDFAPLRLARGVALSALDVVPPAKRAFMQRMIFGAAR